MGAPRGSPMKKTWNGAAGGLGVFEARAAGRHDRFRGALRRRAAAGAGGALNDSRPCGVAELPDTGSISWWTPLGAMAGPPR